MYPGQKNTRRRLAILAIWSLLLLPLQGRAQQYSLADSTMAFELIKDAFLCAHTKPHTSLQLAQQGLDISKQIHWQKGVIKATRVLGFANAFLGKVKEAFRYYNDAYAMSIAEGSWRDQGIMLHSLGSLYYQIGDYEAGIAHENRALKIAQDHKDSVAMADVYSALGLILYQQHLYEKAIHIYEQAVALFHAQQDTAMEAQFLGYIATNYMDMDKYPEAYKYFRRSLDLMRTPNTCTNFGAYFVKQKAYDSALYYYRIGEPIYEADSNLLDLAKTYESIAEVMAIKGETKQARQRLEKALQLVRWLSNTKEIGVMEDALSEVYAKEGDYKNAYEHHIIATKYMDSVLNTETSSKLAEYATRFEVREMQASNKALQRKNELQQLRLQRKNTLIYGGIALVLILAVLAALYFRHNRLRVKQEKTELEQKQLRAQMNPHFIFNCLNSIQHFVVAGDVKNANRYLTGFARLMRQTLEHSKAGTVTLRKEIAYLDNYITLELMRYDNKFDAVIECADNIDQDRAEIPAMIIQPFIENAIRHGLCYLEDVKGKLVVRFYRSGNYMYCDVDDNGIGRERSQELKAANHVVYESHGMELTRRRLELVSRNSGGDYTIAIKDKKDAGGNASGTCITIKFSMEV